MNGFYKSLALGLWIIGTSRVLCMQQDPAQPAAGTCAICAALMTTDQHPRRLICGHTFHQNCIGNWFHTAGDNGNHRDCPTCRELVVDEAGADLHPVQDYQAPQPPAVDNFWRRGIDWTRYQWQRMVPQPTRDALGIALDLGIITAINHGPSVVSRALSRLHKKGDITAIASEVEAGYEQTRGLRTWLPVLEVIPMQHPFGIPPRTTRAAAMVYLTSMHAQKASPARLIALNASVAGSFATDPVTRDLRTRLGRLMQPVLGNEGLVRELTLYCASATLQTLANRAADSLLTANAQPTPQPPAPKK